MDALGIEGLRGLHSQESGDAGLSSNMRHQFSDLSTGCSVPVEDRGSSVMPIPKEEFNISEDPAVNGIRPAVLLEHSSSLRYFESSSGGRRFLKPATPALPQRGAKTSVNPEEEVAREASSGGEVMTDDQDDATEIEEDSGIMGTGMDGEGKQQNQQSGDERRAAERS